MMLQLLAWLETTRFSVWLAQSDSVWAYPTILTLHTVGLALLVGTSIAVDLRLLGFGSKLPVASMTTAFPVMWVGFWLNFVSGVMLFAADATMKGTMPIFQLKLALIAVGVANIMLIRRVVYASGRKPLAVTLPARLLAVSSLAVWLVAIALGRFMAYA
jgi:hypothetical protein